MHRSLKSARRQVGAHLRERRRLVREDLVEERGERLGVEGALQAQQLVGDDAEGEDVGARVHLFAADLLGRQVGGGADRHALLRQPAVHVRELGDAIYHVHAKDVNIDPINTSRNGVLDTKHYGQELQRSWIFRTVGYGHDELFWRNFISNLRMVGYDYVISIEHEDSLMSVNEGLTKAVNLLKGVLLTEETGGMWWA